MSILAEYLSELRTIRNLGAGVAETSYYPPLANLLNAVGKTLKPKVHCLIHLKNTGAGLPEAGFFTASQIQRSTAAILPGQKPSRGALEAKPFETKLDQLAASAQVLRYLNHYNQVLITNLREFRLLVLENGAPRKVESYSLALSTDALFHPSTLKAVHRNARPRRRHPRPRRPPRLLLEVLASRCRPVLLRALPRSLRPPAPQGPRRLLHPREIVSYMVERVDHLCAPSSLLSHYFGNLMPKP